MLVNSKMATTLGGEVLYARGAYAEELERRVRERESLAVPGAFAGTAAVRCDEAAPSMGQSS